MRRLYLLTRDVHLYVGLFISPFILVFAVSVFVCSTVPPGESGAKRLPSLGAPSTSWDVATGP